MGLPSTDDLKEWEREQARKAEEAKYQVTAGSEPDNIQDVIGQLQKQALKYATKAFAVIVAELDNPEANPASRMKAAERILEIIGGKKMETLQIQDEKDDPITTMESMFHQLKNGNHPKQ